MECRKDSIAISEGHLQGSAVVCYREITLDGHGGHTPKGKHWNATKVSVAVTWPYSRSEIKHPSEPTHLPFRRSLRNPGAPCACQNYVQMLLV